MTVKDFGITKDGIATKLYTLKNNNLEKTVNIIMTIINQEYNIGETEF